MSIVSRVIDAYSGMGNYQHVARFTSQMRRKYGPNITISSLTREEHQKYNMLYYEYFLSDNCLDSALDVLQKLYVSQFVYIYKTYCHE